MYFFFNNKKQNLDKFVNKINSMCCMNFKTAF